MSARAEILQRVRSGVGKADFALRRATALARLAVPERGPQPHITGDLAARFAEKAASQSSSVAWVADRLAAPAAARCFLADGSLGLRAVVTADLADLDWSGGGLEAEIRAARADDQVGISGCFCAIAETGSLMMLSGVDTPASISLLPETHIALVPVSRVVATMEDAFALLRAACGGVPRAINFISGPSRTGDIEQTIVLGAHGPCRVHLILTGDKQ